MADTAAHLVHRVLPEVPVRQWVLSLPFALRYRLAYASRLVSDVLRVFVRSIFSSMRRRARERLERLCRYVARPPVATERLSFLPDGRVLYALRHRWRDGTTHVAFEPLDFVAKLAAQVPPPRCNTVRYHGVLAAAARLRSWIVPEGQDPAETVPRHAGCPGSGPASPVLPHEAAVVPGGRSRPRPRNYSWAELMRRVWAVDVL